MVNRLGLGGFGFVEERMVAWKEPLSIIPFCPSYSSSEFVPDNSEFDLNTHGLQK
jgi:hypothetical protein